MKKFLLGVALVGAFAATAHANHQNIFRNAGDLTTGTLPDERVNKSSITAQGNSFNGANQLVQLDANGDMPNANLPNVVSIASANVAGTITSTTGFVVGGGTVTRLNGGAATFSGNITAGTFTGDGSGLTNIGGTVLLNSTQTFTGKDTFNNQVTVSSNVAISTGGVIWPDGTRTNTARWGKDTFTGDAVTTAFVLTLPTADHFAIAFTVNGLMQYPSEDFNVGTDSRTITMTYAPASGAAIRARYPRQQ